MANGVDEVQLAPKSLSGKTVKVSIGQVIIILKSQPFSYPDCNFLVTYSILKQQ